MRDRLARIATWLAPTRTYLVWYVLLALLGVGTCFVPLFNLLGYESAALFGVVGGVATVFLTLHALHVGEFAPPLELDRAESPLADFTRLLVRHLALLALPVAALTLNALRVRNCDFAVGVQFWLCIPVVSLVVGQTIGWTTAALLPDRRWLRNLVAGVVVAASAATFGLHLALQPPIVGHQLFLGYFSGSIYDEALSLPTSLLAYRGLNLAGVGAVLAGLEALRAHRRGRPRRWALLVAALCVAVAGTLWTWRHDLGIGIDRAYIQEQLGGRLETEHFVIHYPERESFLDRLDRLARDHEFRYAEMEEFFETDPADDEKLHSYVYPNREIKGRLMGGRDTLVAKIWLGEMHVLWPRYGHHWLAHELAHLFTTPFAAGPLKLSMQNGIGVNMGLVEGIATAADWPAEHMTPHEASAALRRLEMAPDLEAILGAGGFWTSSSRRAYTLVGSFIRFLIDRHGLEAFKQAYGHGDFEAAYDRPVGELLEAWRTFVDDLELTESQMEVARFLYRRPSIFAKVCARKTAELRRRAGRAAMRGDPSEARRLYEQLIGFAPRNVDYRIEYARKILEAGDVERAAEMTEELLERDLPPVQRARLLQLQGDAFWHLDRPDEAAEAYETCLSRGLPAGTERLLRVKHHAVRAARAKVRRLAFEYLLDRTSGSVSLYFPMEWHRSVPDDPVAAYLVGRRLWQAREWRAADRLLGSLHRDGGTAPTSEVLSDEAARMYGRTLYGLERFEAARRVFERLTHSRRSRYATEGREWLRRIAWRQETWNTDGASLH
jgi:tetratricopeptide (TPR) repeat protein